MKTDIKLQQVGLMQVQYLQKLCRHTYAHYFADYWTPQGLTSYMEEQFCLTQLKADIAATDRDYYFINKGTNPIGFLKLNFQPKLNERGTELEKIYLMPGESSKGYGSKVLQLVEELVLAKGRSVLFLYVLDSNKRGQTFYTNNGYQLVGKSRLHYLNFKPHLRGLDLMSKHLGED